MTSASSARLFSNPALLALAAATFGIGTTEFVIMGLLPEVAADLRVSIPKAGLLISAYALGVTLGGPPIAALTAKLPRKGTLIALMAIFIAGNLWCALSAQYNSLVFARLLTSLAHAAFFGIGSVTAASLVPEDKKSRAIGLMIGGLTLSNVLGVPLGTMLGQHAGWRTTFWAVAGTGVVAMFALARWLPRQEITQAPSLRRELGALRESQVWLALAISVFSSISMFVLFTYVSPLLRDVSGVAPHHVGGALLICGVGIVIGNAVGAWLGDWKLMPSLVGVFLALIAVFALFAGVSHIAWAAVAVLFLWGLVHFAVGTMTQTRVVDVAREGANLAATLNIGAFNLGNAIGAWMGGAALDHGMPLRHIPWLAAAPAAGALALTVTAIAVSRRNRATSTLACPTPETCNCSGSAL
ncbi:DHA1 family inner membrane transport protein [Haloferula luteola]|uniref:DHA1 family inner membrane transport protein n=1 Tax=Haloferula luteola TaxID=595692 RepID=A0A840UZC2_9BACT|nr:MFS transporter [Haloferula luteola]MBB5350176.1 DHA1 family inner membrane transport protein [Haloferula luteola]